MRAYNDISHEELRCEDYGLNNKGKTEPLGPPKPSPFPSPSANVFTPPSQSVFGSTAPTYTSTNLIPPPSNQSPPSFSFVPVNMNPNPVFTPSTSRVSTNLISPPSGQSPPSFPFRPVNMNPTPRVSTTPGVTQFSFPPSVTDPATHGQNSINGQQNASWNTVSFQQTGLADPSPFFSKENPSVQRTLHAPKAQIESHRMPFGPCFRVNVGSIDVDDVSSLMPKLPPGKEYYTKPSIEKLERKEREEPGFCSHVKDFVVGRKNKGSIKFLGETDVRGLDVEPIVQFNDLEVVVYFDNSKKPPVGQGLNKPAEVTLLNVKCVSKLTGKQYVDGPQLRRYEEKLREKAVEIGAEFTSYDPVQGEWKFRVQHF